MIFLWCYTCRLCRGQHGSRAFLINVLAVHAGKIKFIGIERYLCCWSNLQKVRTKLRPSQFDNFLDSCDEKMKGETALLSLRVPLDPYLLSEASCTFAGSRDKDIPCALWLFGYNYHIWPTFTWISIPYLTISSEKMIKNHPLFCSHRILFSGRMTPRWRDYFLVKQLRTLFQTSVSFSYVLNNLFGISVIQFLLDFKIMYQKIMLAE